MHPPSLPNPPRMYRSVGVQTGAGSPPEQSLHQDSMFDVFTSGGEVINRPLLVTESEHTADSDSQATREMDEEGRSFGSSSRPPLAPAIGRIFSLPPYLRDEALQQRMIAEGAVDDREEPLMERRVVSTSPTISRQPFTGHEHPFLATSNPCFRFAEMSGVPYSDIENTSASSLGSTQSRLTVLVHEDTSEELEPPGVSLVDRSAGSTPDSVIFISDRDSGLIHPGSFLRSRTSTPLESHDALVATAVQGSPPRHAMNTRSYVSRSSQVEPAQTIEELVISDESREDDGAPDGDGWVIGQVSPPRPIPALHGPSSLPYARCPSGAEGEIFYNTQSVRDLVWNMDSQSTSREPPYLHPDYVAIVEYTEQSSSKEESEVIVLVDSSLPTQRLNSRGGRSRSTFPQLPTPASGHVAPLSETRRANEWRAQPVRSHGASRRRRDQQFGGNIGEEAASLDFGWTNTNLPASNSDSSIGSSFTDPYHTPIIVQEFPVHVEMSTSVFDPHVASEEQLRHYFIKREQRRLHIQEQLLQRELDEKFRRMSFLSEQKASDFNQMGSIRAVGTEAPIPLTTEHLDLYRSLLGSLDNQQRAELKDMLTSQDPAYRYSRVHSAFPSLSNLQTPASVPPSLTNARSEDTLPPSSILLSPIAPYASDSYDSSPEFTTYPGFPLPNNQRNQGFGAGYLFPAGSVTYTRPLDSSIQNKWEGTPNASLPASTMYYRDIDSAHTSLEPQETQPDVAPDSHAAPVYAPTHHRSVPKQSYHLLPSESPSPSFPASEQFPTQPFANSVPEPQYTRLSSLARHLSQSRVDQEYTQQRGLRDEAHDQINDLDVQTNISRPRSSTLSTMTTARGHRASNVRSLDLGKHETRPGTVAAASSSSMSRAGIPKSYLESGHWRTPAIAPDGDAIISTVVNHAARRSRQDRRPPINISKRLEAPDFRVSTQQPTSSLVKEKENNQPPSHQAPWRGTAAATNGGRRRKGKASDGWT
ncbi:hypothetical protein FRB97_009542 [Tulasnella sp. 331]|nr:hypothetical protein FRB97_009542 [Tulasnella sp. 331]